MKENTSTLKARFDNFKSEKEKRLFLLDLVKNPVYEMEKEWVKIMEFPKISQSTMDICFKVIINEKITYRNNIGKHYGV